MTARGVVVKLGLALIAHHNGGYPRIEDVLFAWSIVGHYRVTGTARSPH